VFVVGVVIAAIAGVATLFLPEIPVQGRAERAAEEAEEAVLAERPSALVTG